MYPQMLPKGTIIKVGRRRHIMQSAVDLQFELRKDMNVNKEGKTEILTHKVVLNPNGWVGDTVRCSIDLNIDIIINISNNKQASIFLDKEW